MKSLRSALVLIATLSALGGVTTAYAQKAQVGQSINEVGQTLKTSQGVWALSPHGKTSAGYAVTLNGKDVGYAVTLTIGHNGMPVAKHTDGTSYAWIGDTFKLVK